MDVTIAELEILMRRAAERYVSSDEAVYFSRLCIASHLHRSPRLNPLEEAVADLTVWKDFREKGQGIDIRTEVEKEGIMVLDFGGLAPSLKLKYVHDELESRCRKNGIAAIGFHNSAGIITLLPWTLGLVGRDLIGLAMFNGGVNCCVPFGGTRGLFGTLPFAYAIPTTGEPILADMAMTEIPFFHIKNAKEGGEPLPEKSAVDRKGLPTTDAAEALDEDGVANLLPIGGGFKGYSLTFLVEILTGSLVRSLLSSRQTAGWNPTEYGAFIAALDIGSFTDIDRFKSEVSGLCNVIRSQQPAQGVAGVAIPGDRGRSRAEAVRKAGRGEIDDDVMQKLMRLGG
jgi:LDH2 family malate/lactate/ureidoglycolate dehydrogenase